MHLASSFIAPFARHSLERCVVLGLESRAATACMNRHWTTQDSLEKPLQRPWSRSAKISRVTGIVSAHIGETFRVSWCSEQARRNPLKCCTCFGQKAQCHLAQKWFSCVAIILQENGFICYLLLRIYGSFPVPFRCFPSSSRLIADLCKKIKNSCAPILFHPWNSYFFGEYLRNICGK